MNKPQPIKEILELNVLVRMDDGQDKLLRLHDFANIQNATITIFEKEEVNLHGLKMFTEYDFKIDFRCDSFALLLEDDPACKQ